MIPVKLILSSFLRARILIALLLYALPFGLLIVFGTFWLADHDWLLPFVISTAAVIGTFRLISWALKQRSKPVVEAVIDAKPLVEANPEWTDRELAVFRSLSVRISERLASPMEWPELQSYALEILQLAAAEVSQGRRKALDFSIPEALLLVDRVTTRLRGDMRRYIPLVDTVTLRHLFWLWSNRSSIQRGVSFVKTGWRVVRGVFNPAVSIVQELQNSLLGEASATLQFNVIFTMQRLILEEVARAAIDLHSGHLRFSDEELQGVELTSQRTDAQTRPAADAPLRVMVVGQASAGKTSLINALSQEDRGETDMAPTTAGLTSYDLELESVAYTFVDSEGFDVSHPAPDALLEELMEADLLLWVVRANRPARAADLALLTRLRAAFAVQPMRRQPRVIVAATAVDKLFKGWPYPEHHLPSAAINTLAELVRVVSRDLGEARVLPVSTQEPEWNIAELAILIAQQSDEALSVQRNRRRNEASAQSSGIIAEVSRASQSAVQLGLLGWQTLWGK